MCRLLYYALYTLSGIGATSPCLYMVLLLKPNCIRTLDGRLKYVW